MGRSSFSDSLNSPTLGAVDSCRSCLPGFEPVKARVVVTLKKGILDPQGKALEGALKSLGIDGIESVRQGKIFEIELAENDRAAAEGLLRGACEKLLANQIVENFQVELL
jgi:phosphoribosylformylglycinamidine synthase subunit PurS